MKSALPGVLLVVTGALITYWALTNLGLFTQHDAKGKQYLGTSDAPTRPGVPE